MNFFLMAMIDVQNQIGYDPLTFFNSVMAIIAGCCAGVVAFAVLPPPSDRRVRRREWRFRLHDRLSQLLAKPPDDEAATAFERTIPLAADIE